MHVELRLRFCPSHVGRDMTWQSKRLMLWLSDCQISFSQATLVFACGPYALCLGHIFSCDTVAIFLNAEA